MGDSRCVQGGAWPGHLSETQFPQLHNGSKGVAPWGSQEPVILGRFGEPFVHPIWTQPHRMGAVSQMGFSEMLGLLWGSGELTPNSCCTRNSSGGLGTHVWPWDSPSCQPEAQERRWLRR